MNGVYDGAARRQDGREAGTEAAASARGAHVGVRASRPEAARQVSHPYPVYAHPKAKDFVDLDEDIQVKDLLHSVQEGFDSTELLKRYSTLGMGLRRASTRTCRARASSCARGMPRWPTPR